MKAQQAPGTGLAGEARQTFRSAPDQVASIMKNRISGGTTQAIRIRHSSVNTQLSGDENRLARSQPRTPDRLIGGGKRSAGAVRKKYCDASVVMAITAPPAQPSVRRDSSGTT